MVNPVATPSGLEKEDTLFGWDGKVAVRKLSRFFVSLELELPTSVLPAKAAIVFVRALSKNLIRHLRNATPKGLIR